MTEQPQRPATRDRPEDFDAREKRLEQLAWLLDESIRLPGGFRVGADGLIGLIPGIGDLAGAALGSYLIYEARSMGAPKRLLTRMAMNVGLETLVGTIPLVGDIFDFYYKANRRNIDLLRRYNQKTREMSGQGRR